MMGTEIMEVCIKGENDEIPPVPPGFESFVSFSLKRVQDDDNQDTDNGVSCSSVGSSSDPKLVKMEVESGISDAGEVTKSLRRRPGINYGQQLDDGFDDDSNSNKHNQGVVLALSCRSPLKSRLPKGVTRGCPQCSTCQKVNARWHPEQACKPTLEDAPVFHPTEEEFEDTLNYIASIRPKAEPYGICRIVPPISWKPPCPLREKAIWESSKFVTRVQRVDKLQNRDSMSKMSKIQNIMRKKRRRCMRMAVECGTDSDFLICEPEFGFERGPEFTLQTFQKYADEFKAQYFRKENNLTNKGVDATKLHENTEPSLDSIEGEYWRIVEKATEEIEVVYGADLETGVFGSGFPKMSTQVCSAADEQYAKSGWNLNNFPRLPGSVLSYESGDISGVLVPWLYIGMCFSSFCWHVEDHHLYSLNYMHWGEPKMWYGVPGNSATKLEEAMRKHLPDLFEEQPDLLHKLVTQLSPSILKSEGVPVYRCVQNAGEFVLTFPRAYHAGFNCGFNCAEAVNVAPVDWLPHGQIAVDLYRHQGRKTSISHDKILLGAAREAVRAHWELDLLKKNTVDNLRWKEVCGKDGILAKTLKERVDLERTWREFLCHSSQALKMESNFDAASERECSFCFFDLHLSAAGCRCSPDKYTCLKHAKQLCSCAGDAKFFLFRYDILELNILVEALEGKLSAVYRWAKLDLGLALTSYISKSSKQDDKSSHTAKAAAPKQANTQQSVAPKNDVKTTSTDVTAAKDAMKSEALPSNDVKPASECHSSLQVMDLKNEKSLLMKEAVSNEVGVESLTNEVKKEPTKCQEDVILLSDDENDDDQKETTVREKKNEVSYAKYSELPKNLTSSVDKVAPVVDASVVSRMTEEHHQNGMGLQSNQVNSISNVSSKSGLYTVPVISSTRVVGQDHNMGPRAQNPQPPCSSIARPIVTSVDNSRQMVASPSSSLNNLDKNYRQKGPRIAKVVRRITCNVEPLELGLVCSGKSWCNSQAIFPKGYRSRVRYISVSDPTNTCYYVSEIVDGGRNGPLFMVSLEHCPSEVFVHVSASRCWEMVRERVNQEITKQHKLGKINLPPLQPPGSLDGLEMFGFSSPAIVQAVEALDRNRICAEYWDSRPYSRPQGHVPQLVGTIREQNTIQNLGTDGGLVSTLKNLFKKATVEELGALSRVVNDNRPAADQRGLMTRLLNEEIRNRPK